MLKIILFYEHLTREWNALHKLKSILENRGNEVKIFSILYESRIALRYAKNNYISAIVVPWFVDESHERRIYPFVEINRAVKIINLHQEQIGSEATETVFMPKTAYTCNGSFHLAWGDNFAQCLKNVGVKDDKIFITGNIRNDAIHESSISKLELFEKYKLDVRKKCILFAENRGYYVQRISPQLRNELIRRGMSNESIDARAIYEKKSLDLFIKDINRISEEFFDKFEVVYRPHPGTKAPDGISKRIHIINDRSIYDWIFACDLFLTNGSTSAFEAEMCGKPVAICDGIEEPKFLRVLGLDNYAHIDTITKVDDSLIEDIMEKLKQECNYVHYVGVVDGKACYRVADAIVEIIRYRNESELEELSYTMNKPSTGEKMRQYFFEAVTWMMTKTDLLYKFKFPRSAYGESRDIPYSKEASWTGGNRNV